MKLEKLIRSNEALARATGVKRVTVSERWLKDPNWRWGKKPWKRSDLPSILAFAKERQRRSADPAVSGRAIAAADAGNAGGAKTFSKDLSSLGPVERASIQVKLETAASRRVDREIKLGKYVLKEEVEKERVARIHAVKNAILALPDSGIIESMRAADSEHEAKEILRGRLIEMCQAFAGGKH